MPPEEKFGLISQIRRASVSIESNLAEGCGRDGDKEFARFVDIAMGSSFELRCQLRKQSFLARQGGLRECAA